MYGLTYVVHHKEEDEASFAQSVTSFDFDPILFYLYRPKPTVKFPVTEMQLPEDGQAIAQVDAQTISDSVIEAATSIEVTPVVPVAEKPLPESTAVVDPIVFDSDIDAATSEKPTPVVALSDLEKQPVAIKQEIFTVEPVRKVVNIDDPNDFWNKMLGDATDAAESKRRVHIKKEVTESAAIVQPTFIDPVVSTPPHLRYLPAGVFTQCVAPTAREIASHKRATSPVKAVIVHHQPSASQYDSSVKKMDATELAKKIQTTLRAMSRSRYVVSPVVIVLLTDICSSTSPASSRKGSIASTPVATVEDAANEAIGSQYVAFMDSAECLTDLYSSEESKAVEMKETSIAIDVKTTRYVIADYPEQASY